MRKLISTLALALIANLLVGSMAHARVVTGSSDAWDEAAACKQAKDDAARNVWHPEEVVGYSRCLCSARSGGVIGNEPNPNPRWYCTVDARVEKKSR